MEYRYCTKLLDPYVELENDSYFADICELDPEDYENIENVGNEENWIKANPIRATYPEGMEKIREDYKLAKEIPEHMTAFLTKCMDIWVQAKENGYMDMGKWRKCRADRLPIDITGRSVYVGFDMSAKIDLTSVAFIIPFLSGEYDQTGREIVKYIVFSHSFIPNREKLAERKAKDKADYDSWERLGYLTVTDTQIVDQNAVIRYVLEFCEKHKLHIEKLCFDPANAGKLMIEMSDEGYEVEEVFQSHKSLNEATQGFREQVYMGNVIYLYNPVLEFAMSNAVVRTNNGLIKIDKDATTNRIDPVDAVLCAYKLALYHDFDVKGNIEDIDRFLESEW
jgi:phage terminase large subunit-like protein